MSNRPPTEATLRRLERSSGALATQAVARMDDELPWFRDDAGRPALVGHPRRAERHRLARRVVPQPRPAAAADRRRLRRRAARAGPGGRPQADRRPDQGRPSTCSRTTSAAVAEPGDEDALHVAVLQFSREVAFATAHVYASFAENRGAWDARLEALVVDALVRGERSDELSGRAAALGWATNTPVIVLVGAHPDGSRRPARRRPPGRPVDAQRGPRRRARRPARRRPRPGTRAWTSVAERVSDEFGEGPVVIGPVVDGLGRAGESAAAALAGLRAARAWPEAPRPVAADALLAERALDGDPLARTALQDRVAVPAAGRRRRGAGDRARGARQRRQPGGQCAGHLRAPQHRPVPAQAGRRT